MSRSMNLSARSAISAPTRIFISNGLEKFYAP